jgi:hypothetical protein
MSNRIENIIVLASLLISLIWLFLVTLDLLSEIHSLRELL